MAALSRKALIALAVAEGLIQPLRDPKVIACNRCQKPFRSMHQYNRSCPTCQRINSRLGSAAEYAGGVA